MGVLFINTKFRVFLDTGGPETKWRRSYVVLSGLFTNTKLWEFRDAGRSEKKNGVAHMLFWGGELSTERPWQYLLTVAPKKNMRHLEFV